MFLNLGLLNGSGQKIPYRNYCVFASRGVVNIIGGLSITIVSGSLDDPLNCEFSFPYTTELAAINTALGGGDILFTSGTTPIARTGQQWYDMAQFNANVVDYLWIGFSRGQMRVLMYSTDSLPTGGRERAQSWAGGMIETPIEYALNPDDSTMLNPDSSEAVNPA